MDRPLASGKPAVIYDGACGLCAGNLVWLDRLDPDGRFAARPLQDAEVYRAFPALVRADCERELHIVGSNGEILAGVAAITYFLRATRRGRILGALLARWPLAQIAKALYPLVAANRYRLGGRCDVVR